MIMIMLMMAYDDECTAQQCQVSLAPTLSGFNEDEGEDEGEDENEDEGEDEDEDEDEGIYYMICDL